MVQCVVCGKEVEPDEADYTLKFGGKTYYYCGLECLYESEPLEKVRHKNISALVLNKSLFEVMALITGLGGVYYTLIESATNALLMDMFSVTSALAAIMIGIDHLKYVREHNLVHRSVVFATIAVITVFVIVVWSFWTLKG